MSESTPISATPDGTGTIIALYVQPRALRTEAVGLHDGALRLRVAALPVDGEANEAIVAFLKKRLGVTAATIRILSGETGRRKRILIQGMSAAEVGQKLLA